METKELWYDAMKLNTQFMVLRVEVAHMPVAYMSSDLGNMEHDIRLRAKLNEVVEKLDELMKEVDVQTILEEAITSKWVFTLEDQRIAIAEVLGKRMTIEEVYEKYGLI